MPADESAAGSTQGWVDAAHGVVRREVFVSDEIYRQELDGSSSEAGGSGARDRDPQPGDYVVRTVGRAAVIVMRDPDGSVRAMLNSCRHRGAKVCRADAGNVCRSTACTTAGATNATAA